MQLWHVLFWGWMCKVPTLGVSQTCLLASASVNLGTSICPESRACWEVGGGVWVERRGSVPLADHTPYRLATCVPEQATPYASTRDKQEVAQCFEHLDAVVPFLTSHPLSRPSGANAFPGVRLATEPPPPTNKKLTEWLWKSYRGT